MPIHSFVMYKTKSPFNNESAAGIYGHVQSRGKYFKADIVMVLPNGRKIHKPVPAESLREQIEFLDRFKMENRLITTVFYPHTIDNPLKAVLKLMNHSATLDTFRD